GVDAVSRAMQLFHALHADGAGSRAFNPRAHSDEQGGEVGDFRLAGAVLHKGFAFGEDGGHEQVFGAGDGDLVEVDVSAFEPLGAGLDVSVLVIDGCAHGLQALDVEVDG